MQVGTHRSLKLDWLRKNYNKLGSFLHAPQRREPAGPSDAAHLQLFLEEIVLELEPVVESRMDSSLALVLHFECKQCKNQSVANAEAVRKRGRAVCVGCGAEYAAVTDESGELALRPMESNFPCASCGAHKPIENRLLDVGARFRCDACGALHEIAGREWAYGTIEEATE
ncbi:MAG: hypothetical protein E4H11_07585 [Myxococcales bacterium]|nr:MAG: hypothetical protein E4H11_07585 [Myxococcales bacterium]